jgi:23S rRNA pseudouridine2605 synthase
MTPTDLQGAAPDADDEKDKAVPGAAAGGRASAGRRAAGSPVRRRGRPGRRRGRRGPGRRRGRPGPRGSGAPAASRQRPAPEPIRFEDVVSGQFDADEQSAEVALPSACWPRRPTRPSCTRCWRRPAWVAARDGAAHHGRAHLGQQRAGPHRPAHPVRRPIKVNGKPIKVRIAPPPPRVIAYHKPAGEVVTHDDPQNRPTVFRKLPGCSRASGSRSAAST